MINSMPIPAQYVMRRNLSHRRNGTNIDVALVVSANLGIVGSTTAAWANNDHLFLLCIAIALHRRAPVLPRNCTILVHHRQYEANPDCMITLVPALSRQVIASMAHSKYLPKLVPFRW
jgi:hypothetical protein